MESGRAIEEVSGVGAETFRAEIAPRYRPVVLRGAVKHWPIAQTNSPQAMCALLRAHDCGADALVFDGEPEIGGRFHYNEDISGMNFRCARAPFSATLARLEALIGAENGPSLYVGSTPVASLLPDLAATLRMPLAPDGTPPRIWVGTAAIIPIHMDLSDNVACVAGGRRRFTLFPPDQVGNLYIGPLDFTPAGQPTALARPEAPDFARYPRFREAMAHAQTAELGPGDAIYIPYLWWHQVQSLDPVNVLVNYWWNDASTGAAEAFDALVHGVMAVRPAPPARRAALKALYDHYVFETGGDPVAHLTARQRGILGAMSPRLGMFIRDWLRKAINR